MASVASSSSSAASVVTSAASSILRTAISRQPVWWTLAASQPHRFPSLNGDAGHYDVVVVGGGIVGVTAALLCKQAGRRVALIEARQIGTGTTGSSTAKLTSQQNLIYSTHTKKHGAETARLYGRMQEAAITEAERIVHELDIKCEFRRMAHYTWTSEDKKIELVRKEAEESKNYGLPAEFILGSPQDLPSTIGAKAAVRFTNQVAFNPYDFCKQVAEHINGDGSAVYEGSRVLTVSDESKGAHSIQLKDGSIKGDHVILATHLPIMDRSGHFAFLSPSRTYCIAVRLSHPVLHEMCISADEPMRSLRIVDDGHVLVVAGESEEVGDETHTEKRYQALEEWAQQHFPVTQVEARWSAMDYVSSDHLSWTGYLYRGTNTIYTATGFSKWGLTQGIASAMIIRDLIIGRESEYSTTWHQCLDARRWNLLKSGPGVIHENVHVTKHFIGDKIAALTAPNIKTLKVGEGGLVKAPSHGTVGAYLDESGHYHVVKPICTHLGCHLLFNQGDKVWDCACHGSQYNIDGQVIHGPAVKDLEQIKDIQW